MQISTLALTDINNTTGMSAFVRACRQNNIQPVAGIEFRRGNELLYVALAQNPEGFSRLNRFLTRINLGETTMQQTFPDPNDVFVIYPLNNLPETLRENEFAGIRPSQAGKLVRLKLPPKKTVVLQPVTFDNQTDKYLHKNLRAIDNNLLLSHLKPGMYADDDETFLSPESITKTFKNFPDIVENTNRLLGQCSIHFEFPKNKISFTDSKTSDRKLLKKLAFQGLTRRYGKRNDEAQKRLQNELDIIFQMDFAAYFLIAHDIVHYAMEHGVYHIGRGSGANSIVAYCLYITDVDPIALKLYFERFINPKRSSPPDFDLDFSWKEREQIQQYIFRRYGPEHVALLGAMVTLKEKSAIRELGKVHGLPKEEIDKLVAHPESESGTSQIHHHIFTLAQKLKGFPHQRSIHAGGIIISEKQLSYFTALDLPPKGLPTTQWDMFEADRLGFEKLDILSQRGIGHIREATKLIHQNHKITIDIHQTEKLKTDSQVKKLLRNGETIGCFYIESPAMRSLLKKLQCDDYLTLVAASSIIRPGVASSGMMREYIRRFHDPNGFRYIHPVMREQLSETYGVMVYQEDVLKVCHHFAGLNLVDADVLRRAMSGKFRGKDEFLRIKDKFFRNSRNQGHPEKIIREVWRQIESFAGYSFSKAHSASYAVESLQSLYLKAHFPLEFLVAVINNFGGFYSARVYFNEITRFGGKIHLPCINRSDFKTNVRDKNIFIGLVHLTGLRQQFAKQLIAERKNNGPYKDLEDFISRVQPGTEQLVLLIRAGAFRFTGKNKPELLWEAHLLNNTKKQQTAENILFQTQRRQFKLPQLKTSPLEDAYDEMELLGFPVSMNPFDMLQTPFRGEINASEMTENTGKTVRMLGLLVTIKHIRTKLNENMYFATFSDYGGKMFDTVHFPGVLKRFPFAGEGIYLLLGKVVNEFGYPSLKVEKMVRMPWQPDPREVSSIRPY